MFAVLFTLLIFSLLAWADYIEMAANRSGIEQAFKDRPFKEKWNEFFCMTEAQQEEYREKFEEDYYKNKHI